MLGLLSQPKQPSAEQVVLTLCDRLSNSLLLEDRKASILALKSLSHDSRELVASSGLRGLLEALTRDSHDTECTRATLETLLILFNPVVRSKTRNKTYRSPLLPSHHSNTHLHGSNSNVYSDIALWLTDELLHNDAAFECCVSLANCADDAFVSFYALQIISAMVANRPTETKVKIMSCNGTAAIVSALGSSHDMIRGESLLLLCALSTDNMELQKLIAFENGFEKLFDVLNQVGGVVFGGSLAEDCLQLLSNLLDNTSNQKLFTQTGFVRRYMNLINEVCTAEASSNGSSGNIFTEQAVLNIEAVLDVTRQLCSPGAEMTKGNQNALNVEEGLFTILRIAFGATSPTQVRVPALLAAAALVNNNSAMQDHILNIDVPYYDLNLTSSNPEIVPANQALLRWCIELSQFQLFDLRCASFICFCACYTGNNDAKQQLVSGFLHDHNKASAEASNIDNSHNVNLIKVLTEDDDRTRLNPFRMWFASACMISLLSDEVKHLLNSTKIGDESLGLELITFIPAVGCELQNLLSSSHTHAVAIIGLLQLLICFTFEDSESVDQLLTEASVIQALLSNNNSNSLVRSLCSVLLGTVYLFCNINAPLPRSNLNELLINSLGRDQYKLYIKKLKQNPIFTKFDESHMFGAPRGTDGVQQVFLIQQFVDLVYDNLGRIDRAIDADPEMEPSKKLTVDMADQLRVNLDIEKKAYSELQQEKDKLADELNSREAELADKQSALNDSSHKIKELETKLSEIESSLDQTQSDLNSKTESLESATKELEKLKSETAITNSTIEKLNADVSKFREGKEKAENGINKMNRELMTLTREQEALQKQAKADKDKLQKTENEANKLKESLKKYKDISEAKDRLQTELTVLKNKYERRLSELNNESDNCKKLQSSLDEQKESSETLRQKYKTLETEAQTFKAKLGIQDGLIASFQKQLKDKGLEIENLEAKMKNTESIGEELEALKTQSSSLKDAEAEAERLKDELKELKDVQAESQELKEKLKNFQDIQAEAEELRNKLKNNEHLISESQELKDKLKKYQDIETEVQDLRTQVRDKEELKATVDKLNTELQEHTESAQKLQDELKETKETAEESQKALDSLMLLLDDSMEKKALYKQKLKAMDEEVSDSNDEASDDED